MSNRTRAPSPVPDPPAYDFSGFFALRTPLLPYDELLRWSEGLEAPAALSGGSAAPEAGADTALEAALQRDRARLRERLRGVIDRPEVHEALFVASPALVESLPLWRQEAESEKGQKTERTLVRYFERMASRCTPFGLFAGCSTGYFGEQTVLELRPRAEYQRHTRLDMDYVASLTTALNRDVQVRHVLSYRPNSSLYGLAGQLRYAERRMAHNIRSYHLVSVETTDFLKAVLERATRGARFEELQQLLLSTVTDVTPEEITDYISSLIDTQILVSDLDFPLTGDEPIHHLITEIATLAGQEPVARVLEGVRDSLAELDRARLGASTQSYRSIAKALEVLPTPVELPRLFQVDMIKPLAKASLGPSVKDGILEALRVVHRLALPTDSLADFRSAFLERYDQREVPLAEALDEDNGVGVRNANPHFEGSPLLQGLFFPGGAEDERAPSGRRERLLIAKLEEALREERMEISLDETDLAAMELADRPALPQALAAIGTLHADSAEAIAAGQFRFHLQSWSGPSGGNLLGRFAHGDPDLTRQLEAHLRAEEALQPDAIFAEIVHLPEGRVGNILARPALRRYEIPFLGRSGVPADHQIPITDLTLSVRGNRLVLRSRRLNREVIPRLTNAHNFTIGLNTYRFLCRLAYQHMPSLELSWGPLARAPFLPRIVCGRIILSPATWTVGKAELAAWGKASPTALFRLLQAYRRRMKVPRLVLLRDSDNELPIDFDNVLSLESFVGVVKGREEVTLIEPLAGEGLVVEGPEGRFAHQIVVPLVARPKEDATVSSSPPLRPAARVTRSFSPGSSWLYAKLYVGTGGADRVLTTIHPVVEKALATEAADRFFFIRYGDPEWHVRVRFHGVPDRLSGFVLPALHAAIEPLRENQTVGKVQLDTYEQELERYGGPEGMKLSEELFFADSLACLKLLHLLEGDEAPEARWQMCFRGIDALLDDLGFGIAEKLELVSKMRAGYAREHRMDGNLERQLGDGFRKRRQRLESLLDPTHDAGDPFEEGFQIWKERSRELRPIGIRLREAEGGNRLTTSVSDLASSYLHMHANRLLRSAARAQELVLTDSLVRCYESRLARQRKGPPR